MRGLGTLVNVAAVLAGTGVGLLLGARLPERVRATMLQGVGLVVLVVGMGQAQVSHNIVFPLVAIAVGGLIGEAVRIEDRLAGLGERLRRRIEGGGPDPAAEVGAPAAAGRNRFVEGFVGASLLFCVGPLTILGSIADGLKGDPDLLIVKAALDGIVAIAFASTLGYGVAFSALTILIVQGSITALAGVADAALTERMVTELTGTGGVMILAIGFRLLDVVRIRVGSFLPALAVAPLLVLVFAR